MGLKGNPVEIRGYPRSCEFQRKACILCHWPLRPGRRTARNESEDLPYQKYYPGFRVKSGRSDFYMIP